MSPVTVRCLLINHEHEAIGSAFKLSLDTHTDISDLREAVQKAKSNNLQDLDADELTVWKLCNPQPSKDLTSGFLKAIHLAEEIPDSKQLDGIAYRLYPEDEVGEKGPWPDKTVHILVQRPPENEASKPPGKRKKAVNDNFEYLEEAKSREVALTAPSGLNSPSTYEKLQMREQERILDDCPQPDADIPPLPLLYDGFGLFLDEAAKAGSGSDGELEGLVDELVEKMRGIGLEVVKKDEVEGLLLDILFPGGAKRLVHGVEGRSTSGGHILVSHGGPSLIVEVKRYVALAEPQLAGYFMRLATKAQREVALGWRQPCLGIVLRGASISFHGLVMVDSQVRCVPITMPYVCNDRDLSARGWLYSAFRAARLLLAKIEKDAQAFTTKPPIAIPKRRRRLPNVSALCRVSSSEGEGKNMIKFLITRRLGLVVRDRYVYVAKTKDNEGNTKEILVKFTREYGKELHEFCASRGFAPKLLGFEELVGGWIGVAMEYFPLATHIWDSQIFQKEGRRWLSEMEDIVSTLHDNGYVHGDLRPPNFIVDGGRLLLVDYDWGGMEGMARFPDRNLQPIIRESRNERMITRQHDEKVLQYTKEQIEAMLIGGNEQSEDDDNRMDFSD